jgi:flagellar hook-associated protein 3 FlgL
MSFNSIGDLANSMLLSQSSLQAKRSMMRLSQELTTGLTSDVRGALRNDYSAQMGWEHSIRSSLVREQTLTEAMTRIQAKQAVLGSMSDAVQRLANDTDLAVTSGTTVALNAISLNAKDELSQTLSRLNVQTSGKSLFAGSQDDGPAMATLQDIIASVKASIAGAVTASDVISNVQDWMDSPVNGFDAVAYIGGDEDAADIRLSNDQMIQETSRADDPALKQAIQNLILASIAMDEDLGLSKESQSVVLQTSATGLRAAEGRIIEMQTSLGYVEAEVAKGRTQAGAEISVGEQLRVSTLKVDQYETASKLQQAELQLEKIYALTARSGRLSLLEYLR